MSNSKRQFHSVLGGGRRRGILVFFLISGHFMINFYSNVMA